jgi:hypothetical protein
VIIQILENSQTDSPVVYNVNETDIPATYIGTISNSTNLKDLAGQDDFGNLKYSFLG